MPNCAGTRHIIKSLCICTVGLVYLLCGGCSRRQQAVDLYVDAVMFKELDQNEMAAEKLNEAVQVNKHFSLAYSLLGEIYQEIKDYEKSAAAYENATKLNPWSFKDFFNLGRAYQLMEKFAQAVKAYVKACELKPDHLQAHVNAAQSFYKIEDYNSALAYGKTAEQIDPNVSDLQKVLGDIYEAQKDYDQAVRSYKRALEIDSNDTNIMLALAVAYLRTNRNQPAKELLTSVIQIQPDNDAARQYLGYCYLAFREEAVKAYEQELKSRDKDAALLASLEKGGEEALDKSIESYEKAVEINDGNWEAYRGLGVAYMLRAIDDDNEMLKSKAVYQWRLSLEIKPDQPRRERLLRLIRKYSK